MDISVPLFITLLTGCCWTTLFSLSVNPGIRGYRNIGLLACYLSPFVFLFTSGWRDVGVTWILFGVAGGTIYTLWELVQRVKTPGPEKPKVGFGHILPGLVAWPIMIPEALEYALAEFGLLGSKRNPAPDP